MRCIVVFYHHSPPQTFPINSSTVKFLPKALPTSHHPLKHFQSTPLLSDSYQKLSQLATTFVSRPVTSKIPILPLSSPHLRRLFHYPPSFETPPQTIPFIMDTDSDFVRFPYTRRYVCHNFSTTIGTTIFVPKQSLSIRILGYLNPKCGLIQKKKTQCQFILGVKITLPIRITADIHQTYLILNGSGSIDSIALNGGRQNVAN